MLDAGYVSLITYTTYKELNFACHQNLITCIKLLNMSQCRSSNLTTHKFVQQNAIVLFKHAVDSESGDFNALESLDRHATQHEEFQFIQYSTS
jgi:hypothetical protein